MYYPVMRGNITSNTRELSTNIGHSTPRPSDNALGSTLGVVQVVTRRKEGVHRIVSILSIFSFAKSMYYFAKDWLGHA